MNNLLHVSNRKDWRRWLEKNFDKAKEIWLVYPKKSSGNPRILYNDAVEEALCFGWIDSTVKTLDEKSSRQRFTPRNPKSNYSQQNKERLKWLLENNLVHSSMVDVAKKVVLEEFVFPEDILDEIRDDEVAWKNYTRFSEAYKRIRIAYIESARKRPDEFKKRLNHFITKTRENKPIGFGGIEKYY